DDQLALQVAVGDGGDDAGDAADLVGQVAGHEIDVVGQILPGAGDAFDFGLATELAFGAHFAGDAGDFGGEGAELGYHGGDGVFQLQDFTADIDGDFFGEVAIGDGCSHGGDVAHLGSQIAGHAVHAVGEVFPGPADALHIRLAAEFAFGADFAGHTGDFRSEA